MRETEARDNWFFFLNMDIYNDTNSINDKGIFILLYIYRTWMLNLFSLYLQTILISLTLWELLEFKASTIWVSEDVPF